MEIYARADSRQKREAFALHNLFKQLKQNLLQRKTETKKVFPAIACLVRQHLLSYLNLEELLKNSKRFYEKYSKMVDL